MIAHLIAVRARKNPHAATCHASQTNPTTTMHEKFYSILNILADEFRSGNTSNLKRGENPWKAAKRLCRKAGHPYPGWERDAYREARIRFVYYSLAVLLIAIVIFNSIVHASK